MNVLLMNYQELEMTLLDIATRRMILADPGVADDERISTPYSEAARRFINLLAMCSRYRDEALGIASGQFRNDNVARQQAGQAFETEKAARLGYRLMEQLRNFAMHAGMPLSTLHSNSERVEGVAGGTFALCSATLSVNLDDLAEMVTNRGTPDVVLLTDLPAWAANRVGRRAFPERERSRVDLMPHVRDYLTGLGTCHGRVRELLRPAVRAAQDVFEAAKATSTQRTTAKV